MQVLLPSVLNSLPRIYTAQKEAKPGVMAQAFAPSKVDTSKSESETPSLQSQSQESQGHRVRACLKWKREKTELG